MTIYRLPFDDDGEWKGGRNWDEPNGGHALFQGYAFDFGHAVGGNIRAARDGWVAFVQNVDGNKHDNPNVPPGGTAVWIRHWDNTIALYAHLKYNSPKFAKDDYVLQGAVLGLSGNTGNSDNPHLHFEVRLLWEANKKYEYWPTIPVQFEDKNHVAWRPKKGDVLASNNATFRQENWRWCIKCQGLFFDGNSGSKCPAGGTHRASGSGNYILTLNSNVPGQSNWRWCKKCQGLFFAGNRGSTCPAGGLHSKSGSGNYVLVHNDTSAPGQSNWRWCKKCQGLFFGGNSGSNCPAGGAHTETGSGNYTLSEMGPGDAQKDWRRCWRCKGLYFAGNSGSTCPAGGGHSYAGSPNYVLVHDYISPNAPGQENWRWCKKCQGLFFAGNTGSSCPAGGSHSKTGSGNYTLVHNASNPPDEQGWEQDWRWCKKCQGLFFGIGSGSKCPAGGEHSQSGSGNYCLVHEDK